MEVTRLVGALITLPSGPGLDNWGSKQPRSVEESASSQGTAIPPLDEIFDPEDLFKMCYHVVVGASLSCLRILDT